MTGGDATFRMVRFRLLIIAFLVLMSCIAVLLLVSLRGNTDALLAVFIALWVGALAWTAYWFLFRVAYEVAVVDGSTLSWHTMMTSHEAPLARIKGVDTPFGPFSTGLRRIRLDGQRSPLLMGLPGVGEIFAVILAFRPDVPINTSWYDRTYERFAIHNVYWVRVGGSRV